MAGWFATLMQKGQARSPRAFAGATQSDAGNALSARDPRYDAIVQLLRDRDADDRAAREKRQRGYRQSLASDADTATAPSLPLRLEKFRARVPCRMTSDARALLDEIRQRFPGSTVTFPHLDRHKQAVMLTTGAGSAPRQIGWVEQCAQDDATRCNVRDQGLVVETDGGTMLVLRFRYPPTAVKMSSRGPLSGPREGVATVEFTEIRPALDPRQPDKGSSPRLVWIARHEVETMNALQSRDYEAFYVRFKLEVQAGLWRSLSALLATSPDSQWHEGSCYTVVRERDAADLRICQRTTDDSGRPVDIGANRIHDAVPATDILLLYLDGDILADFADIYFTLQSLPSTDAYFLKEEFFTVVRRFWASAKSLASRYGSDLATVVRISQHALPMPAQAPLLKQDWINLRQALVDRYGERGRKASGLAVHAVARSHVRHTAWPFETFPADAVNLGLRVVYRQEWRDLGPHRGDVIRTTPVAASAEDGHSIETIIKPGGTTRDLGELIALATRAAADVMKWPLDFEGSINTGIRALAATTDIGLEADCRDSSRDTSNRLSEVMQSALGRIHAEIAAAVRVEAEESVESPSSNDVDDPAGQDAATYVYSRLQNHYEVLTRAAEIENVVLVAEKLPTPAEIDLAWVRRHDWILAKVLLDESFRDALRTIGQAARTPQRSLELDAKREPLYEHIRANVLHYQRAIWQREDAHQRTMRYRKSGRKVPLAWRFELESGSASTIEELCDRLAAPDVNGQFASYAHGAEAALDQLIDPAGPIGYYGNYAIYRMRPEFAGSDMFSMLHFFKSPYLRVNPETGEPEVDDPAHIQMCGDPATDEAFRRERARRITLDTDGVMIDVVRPAPPAREEPECSEDGVDLPEAPASLALVVDESSGMELLSMNRRHDTASAWTILQSGGEKMPNLIVGGGEAARPPHSPSSPVIMARGHGDDAPPLLAGRAREPESDRVILARGDGEQRMICNAGIGAAEAEGEGIRPATRDGRAPTLLTGAPAPNAEQPAIVARSASRLVLGRSGVVASVAGQERLILSRAEGDRASRLLAGAGTPDARERATLAFDDRGLRLAAGADHGADRARARLILAGENEWLRPTLVAG